MESKKILNDAQLKIGIREKRKNGSWGKLSLVKWVHDNSDKGLKDSKDFVDSN